LSCFWAWIVFTHWIENGDRMGTKTHGNKKRVAAFSRNPLIFFKCRGTESNRPHGDFQFVLGHFHPFSPTITIHIKTLDIIIKKDYSNHHIESLKNTLLQLNKLDKCWIEFDDLAKRWINSKKAG